MNDERNNFNNVPPVPDADNQNGTDETLQSSEFGAQEQKSTSDYSASDNAAHSDPSVFSTFSSTSQQSGYTTSSQHSSPSNQYNEVTYGGFQNKFNYDSLEKKKRRSGNGIKAFAIVMCVLFILSTGLFVFERLDLRERLFEKDNDGNDAISESGDNRNSEPVDFEFEAPLPEGELTNQSIISSLRPSVVSISSTVQQTNNSMFWGPQTQTYVSQGSGFIITENGYVITNYHVIEEAIETTVTLNDGTEYTATLIGGDEYSDIAVLKIDADGLSAVPVGDSDIVQQGDRVIAIGCPGGSELTGTVTSGIISYANRVLQITDNYGNYSKSMTVIQTDASINSGNSGGPLVNAYGQVIGVVSMKLSGDYEGIGFALPIRGVISIAKELIENGKLTSQPDGYFVSGKAVLGITMEAVSEEDLANGDPQGIFVRRVTKGGAADLAGIVRGDIITTLDGKAITTTDAISKAIAAKKPGDKVSIQVYRNGENFTVEATLQESTITTK